MEIPITLKDTKVVTVPSAYITGVVTVVVSPFNSSGSVLPAPITWDDLANSSYDKVKPNNAMPIILGAMSGKTTSLKVFQGLAPRSLAASS